MTVYIKVYTILVKRLDKNIKMKTWLPVRRWRRRIGSTTVLLRWILRLLGRILRRLIAGRRIASSDRGITASTSSTAVHITSSGLIICLVRVRRRLVVLIVGLIRVLITGRIPSSSCAACWIAVSRLLICLITTAEQTRSDLIHQSTATSRSIMPTAVVSVVVA